MTPDDALRELAAHLARSLVLSRWVDQWLPTELGSKLADLVDDVEFLATARRGELVALYDQDARR